MMRKFHVEFSEKDLIGNAGLVNLGRFADKLELFKTADRHISIERAPNADYQPSDIISMLSMGVLAGAKHISHMLILRTDTALRTLFKWDDFPVDTTISRIFKLFGPRHCNELSEVESMARKKVWGKKRLGRITLDMDSTVKTVYGGQEGAEKGYNPKKKGAKSYHPLLCFIAETRECLHNWFRSGNSYSANGCTEFMKECFARLPKWVWRVDVRADSAFFDGELLDFIESKGAMHLIKVKIKNLVSLLERKKWSKVKNRPGVEKTEFTHKCAGWKKERRFVAIRIIKEITRDDKIFRIPRIKYEYFCHVTNMDRSPWNAHKYYGKRSTGENWIEWCKEHMAAANILTRDFWANSAIFQTCILACNLLAWFMRLNDEKGFAEEPNTIRMLMIHVPARLMYRGRSWFLRLSEHYFFKERWQRIENSVLSLNFA